MPPDKDHERRAWKLDRGALDTLLAHLDPDPERAALEYEGLRRRLVRFFQMHHVVDPERSADVCLDRLAKRIEEGVGVEKPVYYAFGIARMLLREEHAALRRQEMLAGELQRTSVARRDGVKEGLQEERELALDRCLEQIGAEQRGQILLYYSAAAREKIEGRQQIAEASGISLNALRNRMLRLRKLLEECLRKQMSQRE